MDFELTDEQEDLRTAVRTVLERECPPELVRVMVEGGDAPLQPWKSACELGWTALTIPESLGGLELGFVELALVVEEHGRHLSSSPLLTTLTQYAAVLGEAGDDAIRQRFLPAVAAGRVRGALAIAGERGGFRAPDDSLVARRDGRNGSWILDGTRSYVMDGDTADEVVVAAAIEEGDGIGLFVVPGDEARATSSAAMLDPSRPLATLHCDGVRVEADRVVGEPGACRAELQRGLDWAVTGLALEMVGTAQTLFDRTLEYAKQREQFGRPIGAFQAIQHKLSDMFIALEKARATAYFAAMTIAEDDPRRSLAASIAKASAGDCQRLVAQDGIQIHGGIGFTWEQDVHLYVKRLKTTEALFGTTARHRQEIADALIASPAADPAPAGR